MHHSFEMKMMHSELPYKDVLGIRRFALLHVYSVHSWLEY